MSKVSTQQSDPWLKSGKKYSVPEPVIYHPPAIPFSNLPRIPPVHQTVLNQIDIYYRDQLVDLEACQTQLKLTIGRLEGTQKEDVKENLKEKIDDLKVKSERMLTMAKLSSKIYSEVRFARTRLTKAIRSGSNTDLIRKRLTWLEDRLEKLLHREKSAQILPKDFSRATTTVGASEGKKKAVDDSTDRPQTKGTGSDLDTTYIKPLDYIDDQLDTKEGSKRVSIAAISTTETEIAPAEKEPDTKNVANIGKPKQESSSESSQHDDSSYFSETETVSGESSSSNRSEAGTESSESSYKKFYRIEKKKKRRHKSKTLIIIEPPKSAKVDPSEKSEYEDLDVFPIDSYWTSEHHRFAYSENQEAFLELNPSSYHMLGLAQPGTYVHKMDADEEPELALPWRPMRRESVLDEIHKDSLDNLLVRVHEMYNEVYKAAMISVDSDFMKLSKKVRSDASVTPSSEEEKTKSVPKPSENAPTITSKMPQPYRPLPLLVPDILPTVKLSRDKLYPPTSFDFCGPLTSRMREGNACVVPVAEGTIPSRPSKPVKKESYRTDRVSPEFWTQVPPTPRLVNQKNLYKHTQFTSSLYHQPTVRKTPERGVELLEVEMQARSPRSQSKLSVPSGSGASKFGSNKSTSVTSSTVKKKSFKSHARTLKDVRSFAIATKCNWNELRPESGALEHSGLKWERIKDLVHNNLVSERPIERQEAARSLGQLRCADTMILYALKERLHLDDDEHSKFEVTCALIKLGCWENVVLESIAHFLSAGADNVQLTMLEAILNGKNAQFVDKVILFCSTSEQRLRGFVEMTEAINVCCNSEDALVAYKAAHTLGKLCIANEPARKRLRHIVETSKNHNEIVESCDVLIRQMNCREWPLIDKLLHELRWCPCASGRANVAKLFIFLGPKFVLEPGEEGRIFDLLENRLWDDPCKEVRLEIARAVIILNFFNDICDGAQKKLASRDEDIRAQGVLTIGTLALRNDKIIRVLLEMLELDPSEYIRILIIRAFGFIGIPDKRVLRSLKEKERMGNILSSFEDIALEATNTLNILRSNM